MSWKKIVGWCAAALAIGTGGARAGALDGAGSLASLARLSVSGEPLEAKGAVAALRAAGYPGLEALLQDEGQQATRVCWTGGLDDRSKRWCAAVDAVAGQRDASASRLYWHTDFEKARAQARATGKPILSLRLLGRLDEEFSCANSRFFRVALYADPQIAEALRERFILHWMSVRPAPRITVDFGDGRKLERTITGNSIHYVLAGDGRPIDGLPGLHGPKAFLAWLSRAEAMARRYAQAPADSRESALAAWHSERLRAIREAFAADRLAAGVARPAGAAVSLGKPGIVAASVAMPVAATKMFVERPLLKSLSSLERDVASLAEVAVWAKLSALHADWARLSPKSRGLLARESPDGRGNAEALRDFEGSMALDSVRNEYELHARLHEWFAAGRDTGNVDRLNDRVYAELFLTPGSDPWLGLVPPDRYTGLFAGGLHGPEPLKTSR